MVHRDLLGKTGPESEEIDTALANFIHIVRPSQLDLRAESAIANLDEGEKQTLALAISLQEQAIILMDDQVGRTTAKSLGLNVTGTIGLFVLAKKRGLIGQVLPIFQELKEQGYWLSDALLLKAQQLSGE
jgi:predicted nucleic acid-binding protein